MMPEMFVLGALFRTKTFSVTVGTLRDVVEEEKQLLLLLEILLGIMGIVSLAVGRGRAGIVNDNVEGRCLLGDLDGKQF